MGEVDYTKIEDYDEFQLEHLESLGAWTYLHEALFQYLHDMAEYIMSNEGGWDACCDIDADMFRRARRLVRWLYDQYKLDPNKKPTERIESSKYDLLGKTEMNKLFNKIEESFIINKKILEE